MLMMKASSVMMILMVDTDDSSGRKHPRFVRGRHSIGAASAVSTFDALLKPTPLVLFPNKYAKKWIPVPSLVLPAAGQRKGTPASSKPPAVL